MGNRLFNMLSELEFIDNQIDCTKPFVEGYYTDGRVSTHELLTVEILKRLMMEKGHFLFVFNNEMFSINHSWSEGGMFGSYSIQHHQLNEAGEPIRQFDIYKYYPSIADFLTGEINALQLIVNEIVEAYHEDGGIIGKYIRDLGFFKSIMVDYGLFNEDVKEWFEIIGIYNNEFK